MSSVHLFSKFLTCGLLGVGLALSSQLSNLALAGNPVRIPAILLDRSQIQQINRLIGNLPKSTIPSFANPSAIFTPPHLRVNNNPNKSSRFVDTRNQDCLIGAIKSQQNKAQLNNSTTSNSTNATNTTNNVSSNEAAVSVEGEAAHKVAVTTNELAANNSANKATPNLATNPAPNDAALSSEQQAANSSQTLSEAPTGQQPQKKASKVGLASAKSTSKTAQQASLSSSHLAAAKSGLEDPTSSSASQAQDSTSTAHEASKSTATASSEIAATTNLSLEPCKPLFNDSATENIALSPEQPFAEQDNDDQPFVHGQAVMGPSAPTEQDIYETFALAGDQAVVQFNFEKSIDLYGGINYSLGARDKLIDQAQEQVINTGDMLVGSIYQLQQQLIATSPLFYFLTKSQVRLEAYLSAISSYFRLHNQLYEVTRLTVPARELELLLETIELPEVAAGILNGTYHHQPLEDFKVKLDTAIVEYFRHMDNKQEFANNLAATCNQQSNDLTMVICKVDYLALILASQEISSRYTPVANTLLAYNDLLDRLWYDPALFDNQLIQQRIKAYSEFMRLLETQKSNDWYSQASEKLEETLGTYSKGLVHVYKLAVAGGVDPASISYLNREQSLVQH